MFEGFGFLAAQIALLLVIAALLGGLVGALLVRTARPARAVGDHQPGLPEIAPAGAGGAGAGARPVTTEPGAPRPAAVPSGVRADVRADVRIDDLVAGHSMPPAEAAESLFEPSPEHVELVRVNQAKAELERQLTDSRTEVEQLRAAASELSDRKDAEMGRLETGAIQALETTIASHTQRVDALRNELDKAQELIRGLEQDLLIERSRSERLQAALADRDQHLSSLMAGLGEGQPGTTDGDSRRA
jgi:hypothetical protein